MGVGKISPELLGSVFSGLVLVIGALATFTASRSRRVSEDTRTLRKQARSFQRRFLAAMAHIFKLEVELAERGLPVPPRPDSLEDPDDDDGPLPPTPPTPIPPTPHAAPGGAAGG